MLSFFLSQNVILNAKLEFDRCHSGCTEECILVWQLVGEEEEHAQGELAGYTGKTDSEEEDSGSGDASF